MRLVGDDALSVGLNSCAGGLTRGGGPSGASARLRWRRRRRRRPLGVVAMVSTAFHAALLLHRSEAAAPARPPGGGASSRCRGVSAAFRPADCTTVGPSTGRAPPQTRRIAAQPPLTNIASSRRSAECGRLPSMSHSRLIVSGPTPTTPWSSLRMSAPSENEILTDIEYASHPDSDKLIQMNDLIGGSINITSFEEIDDESLQHRNGAKLSGDDDEEEEAPPLTVRKLWRRRHARSIEEGIRRESTTGKVLSSLLEGSSSSAAERGKKGRKKKKKKKKDSGVARTIAGLVVALAEEAEGLEVEVDARRDTPLWGKHVDAVRINFSKLGFKPIRMGGLDEAIRDFEAGLDPSEKDSIAHSLSSQPLYNADEAFDRIDVDNSGALDEAELASALAISARANGRKAREMLSGLATRLVRLYDVNGDGVVDREEYQSMVEDMSALRKAQAERRTEEEEQEKARMERKEKGGWGVKRMLGRAFSSRFGRRKDGDTASEEAEGVSIPADDIDIIEPRGRRANTTGANGIDFASAVDVSEDNLLPSVSKEGSIVLSDMKLDLRRLLFGAVPWVKRVTPGGPLILEPFTATVTAQFSREDVLTSTLLDEGLRRLVARALKRRARSWRDLVDGSVFFGRTWNMACKTAPFVDVPKLLNAEFDEKDRLIITGRARIRAAPDAPLIENSFKLRTKLGTRGGGRYIRLQEPELALVVECPKAWEKNIQTTFSRLKLSAPPKPKPIYAYIPLVSPFKQTEDDGYNLGDDNTIKSIYIKDGALRFEISAVLRPGRFLGNHYLAFTVPQRTFIITLDRVREGMRVARRNKLAAQASKRAAQESSRRRASDTYNKAIAQTLAEQELDRDGFDISDSQKEDLKFIDQRNAPSKDNSLDTSNDSLEDGNDEDDRPGFFGRFVEGYLGAKTLESDDSDEVLNERLAVAISDWFGQQDIDTNDEDEDAEED